MIGAFLEASWGFARLKVDEGCLLDINEQTAAAALAANQQNIERFLSLDSFAALLKGFSLDEWGAQSAQAAAINAIINRRINADLVLINLNDLNAANVIDEVQFSLAKNAVLQAKKQSGDADSVKELKSSFSSKIDELNGFCGEMMDILEDTQALKNAKNAAKNAEFILAVTGVINAGKSSTLNALLNREILGVSNIPETAALSVIKYGENDIASVEFVDGKISENIAFSDLKEYSGAKSDKSQLVKRLFLGVKAEFLAGGVAIVDTPGLDDAVVWREQLTADYVMSSDFVLHLMNAAQSSTKKDMEFIANMLKNGKAAGLAIGLTHADKLSQNELLSVQNYAKKSISEELAKMGFDENLAKGVRFFSLSAPKNMGIDELRAFLQNELFGGNKAQMVIKNYQKELFLIANAAANRLRAKNAILTSDLKSANEILTGANSDLVATEMAFERIQTKMSELKKRLDYKNISELSAILAMSQRVKDRILGDIKYAKNSGKKPDLGRLGVICESGFRDGIIDFYREFKNRLTKDLAGVSEELKLEFGKTDSEIKNIDIRDFIDKNMPNIGYEELKAGLSAAAKSGSFEAINMAISKLFEDFLAKLDLGNFIIKLANSAVSEFENSINERFTDIKSELLDRQNAANELVNSSTKNADLILAQVAKNRQNIKLLEGFMARLA